MVRAAYGRAADAGLYASGELLDGEVRGRSGVRYKLENKQAGKYIQGGKA